MARFHHMNAYIDHLKVNGTEYEVFTSYDTIISVYRPSDRLMWVGPYYRCSASTRRQFGRYLSECHGTYYGDVRDALEDIEPETGETMPLDDLTIAYGPDYIVPGVFDFNRAAYGLWVLSRPYSGV